MSQRFSYIKYDQDSMVQQQALKASFEQLEEMVDMFLAEGRPKSLCLTALEEAYMWTGKAIRDQQIARQGHCEEQKTRSDE